MKKFKLAVVGAGAAGYFAAAALARNCKNLEVTVIHDSTRPSIGVGESIAWGAPHFMRNVLGLEHEHEWMAECRATYKLAGHQRWFVDANDPGQLIGYPFAGSYKMLEHSSLDNYIGYISHGDQYSLYDIWTDLYRRGIVNNGDNRPDLNEYHYYAKYNTCPVDAQGNFNTFGALGHSYHVNAGLVGPMVQRLVGQPNGVKEIDSAVVNVVTGTEGIQQLELANGETFQADLYIDCTGFERQLMTALDVEFVDCDEYFNDSAIVGMDYYQSHDDFTNRTVMSAMPHGWWFNIPMDQRSGNGYVFNSRINNDVDSLINEWETITNRSGVLARHIKWNPGYYAQCMTGNCLSLGVSYGFADAFDSNGFSATLLYIQRLLKHLATDPELELAWRSDFNYYVDSLANDIKSRIQYAFHLAPRNDSVYWQTMKQAASEFDTANRLQAEILNPARKNWLGYQNLMYSQHTFVNMALYYGIDVEFPEVNVPEYVEQLALNWFRFFNTKNQIQASNSPTMGEFYKNTLYPKISGG